MKKKKILMILALTFSGLLAQAQRLHGFNIEVQSEKIVVFVNNEQVCGPTMSCFVANLPAGTYFVEVFPATEMKKGHSRRRKLYSKRVTYNGTGVHDIVLVGEQRPGYCDDDSYCEWGTVSMDQGTFKTYCKVLENADFDSNRVQMIESLPSNARFTSHQCRDLMKIFDFDSARIKALKLLYPMVVDPISFAVAIDALDFNSGKNDVNEFIKKYNERHNRHR